jgi:hypothetical protein
VLGSCRWSLFLLTTLLQMIVSGLVSAAVMWPVNTLFPKLFESANTFVSDTAIGRARHRRAKRAAAVKAATMDARLPAADAAGKASDAGATAAATAAPKAVSPGARHPINVSRLRFRSPRIQPLDTDLSFSGEDSGPKTETLSAFFPASPFQPSSVDKLHRMGFEAEAPPVGPDGSEGSEFTTLSRVRMNSAVDDVGVGVGADSPPAFLQRTRVAFLHIADDMPSTASAVPAPHVSPAPRASPAPMGRGALYLPGAVPAKPQRSRVLKSATTAEDGVEFVDLNAVTAADAPSYVVESPARPGTAVDVFAGVVTKALDRSMAQRMLAKEGAGFSRWSLVALVAAVQTFIGMFMVLIALFYLITATDRTWRMAVCVGGGLGEGIVGVSSLLLLRQDQRVLGLLVVIVRYGLQGM